MNRPPILHQGLAWIAAVDAHAEDELSLLLVRMGSNFQARRLSCQSIGSFRGEKVPDGPICVQPVDPASYLSFPQHVDEMSRTAQDHRQWRTQSLGTILPTPSRLRRSLTHVPP